MKIDYVNMADREFWYCLDQHLPEQEFVKKVRDRQGYVLREDGVYVGILRYSLFWDMIPFLNLIFVRKEWQRLGYGTILMHFWEEEMKRRKFGMTLVSTQVDETSQHFYRKLGYRDCGSLVLHSAGFEQPTELFLEKAL